jgi:hypothetical protein
MGGNDIYDLMAWQSSSDIASCGMHHNQTNNSDIIVKEIGSHINDSGEIEEEDVWEEVEEMDEKIISATSGMILFFYEYIIDF